MSGDQRSVRRGSPAKGRGGQIPDWERSDSSAEHRVWGQCSSRQHTRSFYRRNSKTRTRKPTLSMFQCRTLCHMLRETDGNVTAPTPAFAAWSPSPSPAQSTYSFTTCVGRSWRMEPSVPSWVLVQSEAWVSFAPEGTGTGLLKVVPLIYPLRILYGLVECQ